MKTPKNQVSIGAQGNSSLARRSHEAVIQDLRAARWRLLMHLARQRPYHGARTNCRWHETRHG